MRSILLENVALDMTHVSEFMYKVTSPIEGIRTRLSMPTSPPLVSIQWLNATHPPQSEISYPIFNVPSETIVRNVTSSAPEQWWVAFFSPPLLAFRLVDTAPPPITVDPLYYPPVMPEIPADPPAEEVGPPIDNPEPVAPPAYDPYPPESIGGTPSPSCNPPSGFLCDDDGTVLFPGNLTLATFVLPIHSGTITILGNVNISGLVTFIGLGNMLNVTGCAKVDSIVLELNGDNPVPTGPITLVSQSENCSPIDPASIVVTTRNRKECEKVTIRRIPDAPIANLNVLLAIDKSKCGDRVKWIIVGSVLGAALIIFVLVALIIWRMRSKSSIAHRMTYDRHIRQSKSDGMF